MPGSEGLGGTTPYDSLRRAGALLQRHLGAGDRQALDQAIELYRGYLAAAFVTDRYAGMCAGNLLVGLSVRYPLSRDRRDLDEIIALGASRAVRDRRNEQDARVVGTAYVQRYHLDGRRADLDAAIDAFRRAVAMTPGSEDNRAAAFNDLGIHLFERFELLGDTEDLAGAESAYRSALRSLPPGSSNRPGIMSNLAATRERAHVVLGDVAALGEAVELLRTAVGESPPGSAARRAALANLSDALSRWVEHTGDEADYAQLLQVSREAVAATPPGHPDHPARLAGLGKALRITAEYSGVTEQLAEAAGLLREAVRRTGHGDRYRASRLTSLGNVLHRLAEHTGDLGVLDEAIGAHRQAVVAYPRDDPQRTSSVGNLAVALRERHRQTGDLTALREAAELARQALEGPLFPDKDAVLLNNLGVILQSWHERTDDSRAAAEAVEAAREVLARTPAGSPPRADRLNVLANALRGRFAFAGDPADLDEALRLLEEAAELAPYGGPELAIVLSNLGAAWRTKHEFTGDPEALDEAVYVLGRAVWASSGSGAPHGGYLRTYGDALRALHDLEGDPGVLRAAQDAYRDAALTEALPAADRVTAAWRWGAAAADGELWQQALEGYELAVRLLPFVASGRLERSDQEHGLALVSGLAAEAAACAVNAGQPERAALLLEHGRGILLSRSMAARDELARLRGAHPDAAERLTRLQERIEALDSALDTVREERSGAAAGGTEAVADRRHELAAEWERLVAEIRSRPESADFLAAPSPAGLLECAEHGPVVLAYCSRYRSDALLLHAGRVDLVPLPEAFPEAVERQVIRLEQALEASVDPARERYAQRAVSHVLAWTWDCVTGPVLDRLGFHDAPRDGVWPRVWWSPGGALAALPLHAAGHHQDGMAGEPAGDGMAGESVGDGEARSEYGPGRTPPPPLSVIDRVVSSYTPTVRALAYARARASGPPAPGRLLAVALRDTPGARPLPGVEREVRALEEFVPVTVLAGGNANRGNVLHALPEHPVVHFACHGVGDPDDASAARLLLYDHQQRPLTVRQVSRLDLTAARLAVLSACETSRGVERLADESVHITSAFQLAGYPHVVGTLWPVHDVVAVRVTKSLYGGMCDGDRHGGEVTARDLDTDRAAVALHHAVRECRARFRQLPSLWAAHVHAGA